MEHFPRQDKVFIGWRQALCIRAPKFGFWDFSLQAGTTIAFSSPPHVVPVFSARDFVQSGMIKS
jgi:hypothetical protein